MPFRDVSRPREVVPKLYSRYSYQTGIVIKLYLELKKLKFKANFVYC